jgi:hypothetical protein
MNPKFNGVLKLLVVKSHEIDASPCPNGIETNYCY